MQDGETEYESEEQGVLISEGFVDDLLEKAETKTKEIVAAALESAFLERNYEFKIDLVAEKNETRIDELMKDF